MIVLGSESFIESSDGLNDVSAKQHAGPEAWSSFSLKQRKKSVRCTVKASLRCVCVVTGCVVRSNLSLVIPANKIADGCPSSA